MYHTIREQGDHLVQLALGRDQAVLELDQVKFVAVRVENEDLHGQLAKYGQVIRAYDNRHTPPSRKTITQRDQHSEEGKQKKRTPPAGAANT